MVRRRKFACDWFQDLKLYKLSQDNLNFLQTNFQSVEIVPVNCDDCIDLCPDAEVYIGNRISEDAVHQMKGLKWVHFGSIGIDKLSKDIIKDKKLTITNSRNTIEEAVSASALAFVFALAREHLNAFYSRINGSFSREQYDKNFNNVNDVYNSTFTVLGYGPISKKFIEAILGFTKQINVVTRTKREDKDSIKFYLYDEINEAVKDRDFIVNFLPETDLTSNLVNEKVIGCFGEKTFYINVGRNSTNDENALLDAIDKRNFSAMALDVYSRDEFLVKQLLKNDRVLFTPHVAAVSVDYWHKQMKVLKHNIKYYLNDELSMMKNLIFLEGQNK